MGVCCVRGDWSRKGGAFKVLGFESVFCSRHLVRRRVSFKMGIDGVS